MYHGFLCTQTQHRLQADESILDHQALKELILLENHRFNLVHLSFSYPEVGPSLSV